MKIWIIFTTVLISLLWMMRPNIVGKLSVYFGILLLVGCYISWTQYLAGCGFTIGECYADSLSIGHEWLKLAFALISEISWLILGIFILYLIGKKVLPTAEKRAGQRGTR